MTNSEKGWAYSATKSHRPLATKPSISWSARRHMNSSFSFSRFGVSNRIMRPR